jgi:hypothetical protein
MSNDQKQKDMIKNDIAMKAKPKCGVCGKFKNEAPLCTCTGGVSSASEGGGSDNSSSAGSDVSTELSGNSVSDGSSATTSLHSNAADSIHSLSISDIIDQLTYMLKNEILMIHNDSEKGILTIKLLHSSALLPEEQKLAFEYLIKLVLNELSKFKKDNGISSECKTVEKDSSGNIQSLIIMLPHPGLYDAFITRLLSHELFKPQVDTPVSKSSSEYQSPRPRSILDGLKRQ